MLIRLLSETLQKLYFIYNFLLLLRIKVLFFQIKSLFIFSMSRKEESKIVCLAGHKRNALKTITDRTKPCKHKRCHKDVFMPYITYRRNR